MLQDWGAIDKYELLPLPPSLPDPQSAAYFVTLLKAAVVFLNRLPLWQARSPPRFSVGRHSWVCAGIPNWIWRRTRPIDGIFPSSFAVYRRLADKTKSRAISEARTDGLLLPSIPSIFTLLRRTWLRKSKTSTIQSIRCIFGFRPNKSPCSAMHSTIFAAAESKAALLQ